MPTPPSQFAGPAGPPGRSAGMWLLVAALVAGGLLVFGVAISRSNVAINGAQQFARVAYCSVPGNLSPEGAPLQPGTFLDLVVGEPDPNGRYAGATPASFVESFGLTCSDPPPGYIRDGFAGDEQQVAPGIYPYYRLGPR